MRNSEFLRKLQFPVIIGLGTFCIGTCLAAYFAPEMINYAWLFAALYVLLTAVGLLIPGKLRILLSLVGAAALITPPVLLLSGKAMLLGIGIGVIYAFLTVWSMSMGGWDPEREISAGWLGFGLPVLLVGCFFATFVPRLCHLLPWFKGALFAFALLGMLSLNRRSRTLASGGRQSFTPIMRQKNILLTLGMFAIALVVALVPSVYQLIKNIILWLVSLIPETPEETEPMTTVGSTEAVTGPGMEGLFDNVKPSRTPEEVYLIMAAVAIIVMVPLTCVAAVKLFRWARRMLREFFETVTDGISLDSVDFLDEITDTREAGDSSFGKKAQKVRKRSAKPVHMTPAEQIRYRYLLLTEKHPEWGIQSTARENLPEPAAKLYEQARYSQHPVSSQDAEDFQYESM